jgi:hypothetical protein
MSPSDSSGPVGATPGPGGGYPVDQPAQPNPQDATGAMLMGNIISSARRLSRMYPAANSEFRSMLNLASQAQQKMTNSKPAPETSAPPV